MDIARELVIREAMFDELDRRVAASGDGNLSWELTERFTFFGEAIAMRQAPGKGNQQAETARRSTLHHHRLPRSEQPASLRGLDR